MNIITDHDLRLRPIRLPDDISVALPWYQDEEVLYYSEGDGTLVYDRETIERMYGHLSSIGELYIIEILHNDKWIPIGDVTLAKEMLPIVIGVKEYRGQGIGKRVMRLLIERAKSLGWTEMKVNCIYSYNVASRRMFESLGFIKTETKLDQKGRECHSFILYL